MLNSTAQVLTIRSALGLVMIHSLKVKVIACTLVACSLPVDAENVASLDSVTSQIDSLPRPASVMSTADGVASSVSNIIAILAQDRQQFSILRADIDKLNRQIDEASTKNAAILRDFQNGYFCNQCHRAMSEFPSPADFQHTSKRALRRAG